RPGETPEVAEARSTAAKAELAKRGDLPLCFVADTPVQTPDGPVPIDAIVRGQLVLARGVDQVVAAFRVLECRRGAAHKLYHVEVAGSYTLTATGNHPFFVAGKGWIVARDLAVGDPLIGLDGAYVPVTGIKREELQESVNTFNLHVDGASSYFVG